MDRKQVKNAFEELNPTEQQIEKMRECFRNNTQVAKRRPRRGIRRMVAAAVIGIGIFSVSGIGINAATNGAVVTAIKRTIGLEDPHEEILKQVDPTNMNRDSGVYASDLFYIDEKWVVFGGLRGIVIYDLENEKVAGTIDTQAIGCIYFGSETMDTHVIKKEDSLFVFNSENGVPKGNYFEFKLSEGTNTTIQPSVVGSDVKTLQAYYKQWKQEELNYMDTYDLCNDRIREKEEKFSERSLKWVGKDKVERISYLEVDDNACTLNTYQTNTKSFITKELKLTSTTKENTQVAAPEFVYTGEDLEEKAICEYLQDKYREDSKRYYVKEGEVWIPGFIIHKKVKKGDEQLVFGNFWKYIYLRKGNIMDVDRGGDMPACFHLKKNGDRYVVASVDIPRDGAYFIEDIKKFTKGYPGVAEKLVEYTPEKREAARKRFLRMYRNQTGLDLKYYKDSGWNPVEIGEN